MFTFGTCFKRDLDPASRPAVLITAKASVSKACYTWSIFRKISPYSYKLIDSGVQARRAYSVPVQSRKTAVMVGRTVRLPCCGPCLSQQFSAAFLMVPLTLPSLQGGHAQLLQLPADRPHLHGLFLPHRMDHRGVQKVVSCKWAERGKRQPSGCGDPEAYAANFYMKYRRGADYVCIRLGRHTYHVKEMLHAAFVHIKYTMFLILRT